MDRWQRTKLWLTKMIRALHGNRWYDAARDLDVAGAQAIADQKTNVTLSAWVANNRNDGKRWACIGCALLTILFNLVIRKRITKDHCIDALSGDGITPGKS